MSLQLASGQQEMLSRTSFAICLDLNANLDRQRAPATINWERAMGFAPPIVCQANKIDGSHSLPTSYLFAWVCRQRDKSNDFLRAGYFSLPEKNLTILRVRRRVGDDFVVVLEWVSASSPSRARLQRVSQPGTEYQSATESRFEIKCADKTVDTWQTSWF
jgi:hypothetical protein